MFQCVNIRPFYIHWQEDLSCFIHTRGTKPEIGAKEWISRFGAILDHSEICDRTFELTVWAPWNSSPKEFPGVSRNVPAWQKVIRHLFISISIKENLLLCKKRSRTTFLSDFFLSHIFWVHLCPRNIRKISQTCWEGWPGVTEMKERNVSQGLKTANVDSK